VHRHLNSGKLLAMWKRALTVVLQTRAIEALALIATSSLLLYMSPELSDSPVTNQYGFLVGGMIIVFTWFVLFGYLFTSSTVQVIFLLRTESSLLVGFAGLLCYALHSILLASTWSPVWETPRLWLAWAAGAVFSIVAPLLTYRHVGRRE
jgi:hypothetical protein